MNKKGWIQDFAVIGFIIFVLSIVILVGGKLIGDINDQYQTTGASADAKNLMSGLNTRFSGIFDYIFATVFVLSVIALFVSFFMLDTHPAVFFISVLTLLFLGIPYVIMGNVYDVFSKTSDFSTTASGFGIMNWIMNNWVFMLMILGVVGLVLLYAKIKASSVV